MLTQVFGWVPKKKGSKKTKKPAVRLESGEWESGLLGGAVVFQVGDAGVRTS